METSQWTSRPLGEVVRGVATAVVDGQAEIDRSVTARQRARRAAGEERGIDLPDVTGYRFAEVDVDLSLAVSLSGEEVRDESGAVRGYRPVVKGAPTAPGFADRYEYDADLASSVRARMVPVPALSTGGDSEVGDDGR